MLFMRKSGNKRKLYGFETTNRAKHNLKVHLILVCKYRKRLLIESIKEEIKNAIYEIESKSDFNIIEMESVCSSGEASPETIRNYIANQG